jgi:hypothetical protein
MKRLRNVLAVLALVVAPTMAAEGPSAPEAQSSLEIPYASLDEALKALHAKSGVTFHTEGGWIIAYDSSAVVSWLLTPPRHPAYPSIVKRHIVNTATGSEMATDIRCFATQAVCDKYFGGR